MTALRFNIEGLVAVSLDPFEAVGTEAVSKPYVFDVACDLNQDTRPPASTIGSRATLTIEPTGSEPREIHGIIESFSVSSSLVAGRPPVCRFRLVPMLSLLTLSRRSQLFGTTVPVTAADVIASEMAGALHEGTMAEVGPSPVVPHEMRLEDVYPALDHLAQYEETNLDFVSRLSERYGIFYFFENVDGQERVVFADNNLAAPFIAGDATLNWRAWSAGSTDATPETIQQFEARHVQVSSKVFLRNYNYRTPKVSLLAEHQVGAIGAGVWTEAEDRFLTQEEGEFLARVRAEEMKSYSLRLHGRSMVARLSAGHAFRLQDHPFDELNEAYLVLEVQHTARVARPGLNVGPDQPMGYFNTFTVLPLDVPFRPARRTARPKLAGLMNGVIEGGSTGTDPLLDNQGRYKVRLPFDLSNSPDGEGSRWIRLATPFGGEGDGMHFPLHPGTEVVVAHVNGDPDRPVILGAVSNPATPSLVNGQDPSHNRITFRSGMGFDASTGSAPGNLGAATNAGENLVSNNGNTVRVWVDEAPTGVANTAAAPSPYQWLRLGAAVSLDTGAVPSNPVPEGDNAMDGFDLATGGVGRLFAAQDMFLIRDGKAEPSSTTADAVAGKNRLIAITGDTMTLAHDGDINIGEATGKGGHPKNVNVNATDSYNVTVDNVLASKVFGNNMTWVGGDNTGFVTGLNLSAVGGDSTTIVAGVYATVVVGATFNLYGGLVMNINGGWVVNLGSNTTYIRTVGKLEVQPASMTASDVDTKISVAKTDISNTYSTIAATDTKITTAKDELTVAAVKMSEVETKLTQLETNINEGIQTNLDTISTAFSDLHTHIGDMDITLSSLVMTV